NYFYIQKKKFDQTEGKRIVILGRVNKKIRQLEQHLFKLSERLSRFDNQISYRMLGDIIMANLNNIPQDAHQVTLFNFYDNTSVEIKLNPPKTPQKIAEQYYRKSKKEGIEKSMLAESINKKQDEIKSLKVVLEEVEKAVSYKDIVKYDFLNTNSENQVKTLPYKVYMFEGFEIRVGKNSKANDELTFNYSFKDDLWLHARDTPGSHVLIKYKSDKKIPGNVIEKAAGIAAYYSKRKNEAHVPVIYTEKKYVRKRKSDRPGLVIVQKENVLMVTPENLKDHQDAL
ncbi:MAG: NFACT RNA binding domain-containing protein, partial [Cyclobacteriaceae bacterium]|nr:NFACT RNA binding domain-containing protein [Cyclobacteriaceae bacterium]